MLHLQTTRYLVDQESDGFEEFVPALGDPDATLRRWPDSYLNSACGQEGHSWFSDFTTDGRVHLGQIDWRAAGL